MLRSIRTKSVWGQKICPMPRTASYEAVKLERKGPLAILTLNRPDRFNAMNPDMYNEIMQVLNQESENDESSMLAITGEGFGLDIFKST
jgi:enoyl-CoA hydratase/carnithine racemase